MSRNLFDQKDPKKNEEGEPSHLRLKSTYNPRDDHNIVVKKNPILGHEKTFDAENLYDGVNYAQFQRIRIFLQNLKSTVGAEEFKDDFLQIFHHYKGRVVAKTYKHCNAFKDEINDIFGKEGITTQELLEYTEPKNQEFFEKFNLG